MMPNKLRPIAIQTINIRFNGMVSANTARRNPITSSIVLAQRGLPSQQFRWSATRRVAGMSSTDNATRELLRDAFTRLIEHVDEITDGLTDGQANYRPSPNANSIAWLIWHSARVQDVQLAPIAGVDQV